MRACVCVYVEWGVGEREMEKDIVVWNGIYNIACVHLHVRERERERERERGERKRDETLNMKVNIANCLQSLYNNADCSQSLNVISVD